MRLLDGIDWQGRIFKAGEWVPGRGGDYPVVEPATGAELGRMGWPPPMTSRRPARRRSPRNESGPR
jgi:benzaldehyde dehydrogenase (NAD)